ncbi:MAG: M20 family metallopeptidase [Rhodospirillales bacterium]|nr:M20 family metallopeptidase [Rhodospirillales bacterium]
MAAIPDVVELTRTLVGFDTVNPPGNERACAETLGRILEGVGFKCAYHEFAPGRASLVARVGRGGARPPLCFTGHIDTVPLGAQPWTRDPFAGEIAGGRMYGRGTSDMKSGVAAFVAAAAVTARDLARGPGAVLVITAGEETGCEGAAHLAATGTALGDAGAIVVAEPTANRAYAGHKGALWLKARTRGVTAHGSMPERGVNAVHKAARAVGQLADFDFNVARHPVMGAPTLNVGTIKGGLNVNSVPDQAEIGIDIRTIPGQRHDAVRSTLATYLGSEVEVEPFIDVEGVWTDPGHPWMRQVYTAVEKATGVKADVRAATYFTDAAFLTPALGRPPTVILGPGEPELAHQTDEYCVVERIREAEAIFTYLALEWSQG